MRQTSLVRPCLLYLLTLACSVETGEAGDEATGGSGGSGGAESGGMSGSGGVPDIGGQGAGGAIGPESGGALAGSGGSDDASGGASTGGLSGAGGSSNAETKHCRSFYNSSGGANPCYIGSDGKAHCIQVDGSTFTLNEVPGTIVSVTGWDYTTRACAVNDSGAAYCGDYGALTEWIPGGATHISGLANGACAIVDGAVRCNSVSVPETVDTGPGNVTLLGCYSDGCCAATDAPALICWGDTSENFGVDSMDPYSVPLPAGKQVLQIGAGQVHACVLLDGGQVQCWGQDWNGQLGGLGANMEAGMTLVADNATGVFAGQFHTCVSLDDGTVACAGAGGVHGAGQNSMTLAVVPGISTAVAVTGGRYSSCALLADLSIQCWGDYGDAGQGNNETILPVPIAGPPASSCD